MRGLPIALLSIILLVLASCDYFTTDKTPKDVNANDYFAGKTIEWMIPFKEGGGSDTWARFNAKFLAKHLPGNPTIVVINIPGGGSIKGANIFAERATSDGMVIFGTSGSTQLPFLLDDPRVRYDYKDFKPVMVYPNGGVVYISPQLGIESHQEVAELKNVQLKYASQGPTSLDIVPILGFHLLNFNVKPIFGFRGRGVGRLAFERGEVKIDYQTSSSYLKNVMPLVDNGEAIPMWSWGVLNNNGDIVRDPTFPDLPHFGEVYETIHGKVGTDIAYRAWKSAMSAGFGGMKIVLVPKDTPDSIVQIYQTAIENMKKDPEYIQNKARSIGYYEQLTGESAEKIYKLATTIDGESRDWIKNFLRKEYDLNL